ncbi:hypothetical protein FHS43_005257 [Streptosporangium becharense]|uniref:DUF4386 domain-containing protein n=1 Tax=Streptosporangium becharense TaxID=1816182 RepID=A0A7W9IJE7_9ACTN|nr:DUF4386 domain-containing protein [Streptosporangium becharense]MBB2913948.1 hypothetical protein [Streptosporangium becharense]MBB5821391.1 hypothetical protein [Streptosporangium becharense]
MSGRTIGRTVGALLLLAFVAYGGGNALVESGPGTAGALSGVLDHQLRISAGALLMLVNSVAVAGIGVLVLPVLKPRHEISAYAYLVGRAVEAVMLAVGVVLLLLVVPLAREQADGGAPAAVLEALGQVAKEGNRYSYQIAMIALGISGVLFCRVLLRDRLVPAFMALWGLAGYAVFLIGAIAEVLGYGIGVALSVPGGLFEVALGVLLIVRGFPAGPGLDRDGSAGDVSPALR